MKALTIFLLIGLSLNAIAKDDCTVYVQSNQIVQSLTPTLADVANYQRQIAIEAKLKSSLRKNNFEIIATQSEARFKVTEYYSFCQINGLDELSWVGGLQDKPFHWENPVTQKCEFGAAEINLFDKVSGMNLNMKATAEKGVVSKPNVMTAFNKVLKQLPECN